MYVLLGMIIGLLYSCTGFGKEGEAPRFYRSHLALFIMIDYACSIDIYIIGLHIYLFFLPISTIWEYYNIVSFSLIMTIQGLMYKDRFVFKQML
jgi:hypothetical protein